MEASSVEDVCHFLAGRAYVRDANSNKFREIDSTKQEMGPLSLLSDAYAVLSQVGSKALVETLALAAAQHASYIASKKHEQAMLLNASIRVILRAIEVCVCGLTIATDLKTGSRTSGGVPTLS